MIDYKFITQIQKVLFAVSRVYSFCHINIHRKKANYEGRNDDEY